ncbi:MAG TPA: hypothetical protein VII47_00430 [Actinomycetota bacterium]|jgi:hypothetical protein
MSFKFPGMDRLPGRGTHRQVQPSVPDDMRQGLDKAKGAFARLAKGHKIPPMPAGRPLTDADRKAVANVIEELTGKKPKGRVNDPEVNQRLGRLFGGGSPMGVSSSPPEHLPERPAESPPVFRQGGQSGRPPPRF